MIAIIILDRNAMQDGNPNLLAEGSVWKQDKCRHHKTYFYSPDKSPPHTFSYQFLPARHVQKTCPVPNGLSIPTHSLAWTDTESTGTSPKGVRCTCKHNSLILFNLKQSTTKRCVHFMGHFAYASTKPALLRNTEFLVWPLDQKPCLKTLVR